MTGLVELNSHCQLHVSTDIQADRVTLYFPSTLGVGYNNFRERVLGV